MSPIGIETNPSWYREMQGLRSEIETLDCGRICSLFRRAGSFNADQSG